MGKYFVFSILIEFFNLNNCFIRIFICVLAIAALFSGCLKERNTKENKSAVVKEGLSLFQPNATSNRDVKDRVHKFRQRLNSYRKGEPQLRDGGLSTKDAEWNIEAALNATYARADVSFSKLEKNTLEFVVPTADGAIRNEELFNAFENARVALSKHYDSITAEVHFTMSFFKRL